MEKMLCSARTEDEDARVVARLGVVVDVGPQHLRGAAALNRGDLFPQCLRMETTIMLSRCAIMYGSMVRSKRSSSARIRSFCDPCVTAGAVWTPLSETARTLATSSVLSHSCTT
eukprot:SAG11_NODE_22297_length_408_cov_1.333333_1_plen_114_part_10